MSHYYYPLNKPGQTMTVNSQPEKQLNQSYQNSSQDQFAFKHCSIEFNKNEHLLMKIQQTHKENSLKQPYEIQGHHREYEKTPNKMVNSHHHQRTLSDYQINLIASSHQPSKQNQPGVSLPIGGGKNISSKILEKSKLKTNMHSGQLESEEKNSLVSGRSTQMHNEKNGKFFNKIKQTESLLERQFVEKKQEDFETLTEEVANLKNRLTKNEEFLHQISKEYKIHQKKYDEPLKLSHSNSQNVIGNHSGIEEIKNILNFIENLKGTQAKTLDDHRKMIDQLRKSILQCNTQLKSFKKSTSPEKFVQASNQFSQELSKKITKIINEKCILNIKSELQNEVEKLLSKVKDQIKFIYDKQSKQFDKNIENLSTLTVSSRQFQGKMISFDYSEAIQLKPSINSINTSAQNENSNPPQVKSQTSKSHCVNLENKKQIKSSLFVITSKTYFIDPEGFLLDCNKYYLLNSKGQAVQLSTSEKEILRSNGILD